MIKDSFLAKFNAIDESSWRQMVPGRVGRLRLRGNEGALDHYMVYFPTGSEGGPERSQLMRTITANMAARSQVLALIFGDFNFVEESRD